MADIESKSRELHIVNKAPHYNDHPKGYEAIDVIEDAPNGLLFNALKYLWRVCWGNKGGPEKKIEDLEKSVYYTLREIKNRKEALEIENAEATTMMRVKLAPDAGPQGHSH